MARSQLGGIGLLHLATLLQLLHDLYRAVRVGLLHDLYCAATSTSLAVRCVRASWRGSKSDRR